MDDAYWVASDGRQRTPGGGIGGGAGQVSPAGRLHAVDPTTERVLCGMPIRSLVPFRDMRWVAITSGLRCSACVAAAADRRPT